MSEVEQIPNYRCGSISIVDGAETYVVNFGQYNVTSQEMKLQITVGNNSGTILNHVYDVTPTGITVDMDENGVSLKGKIQVSNHAALNIYEFVGSLSVQSKPLITFERDIVVITQPKFN